MYAYVDVLVYRSRKGSTAFLGIERREVASPTKKGDTKGCTSYYNGNLLDSGVGNSVTIAESSCVHM